MEIYSVLGFSRLLLTEEEAAKVILSCRKLNRYLTPSEMAQMFHKSLKKEINPEAEERMKGIWLDFCRDKDLDQRETLTDPDTLEAWFAYAAFNYKEPLPETSPWGN